MVFIETLWQIAALMSYEFDGANDRLTGTFATTYLGYPVTLAAWLKVTTHPTAQDGVLAFGETSGAIASSHSIHTGTTDDTWQARSNDTSGFGNNHGDRFFVGDFTGDGNDDVLFYHGGDRTWWVGKALSGSFSFSLFAQNVVTDHLFGVQ